MYDAIVIGARCAGSPTAMHLARRGFRVLLVDRAEFPSDTLSLHVLKRPAVAALHRWGLLEDLKRTRTPPILTLTFDVGPFQLTGRPPALPGVPAKADADFSPRRFVLDPILAQAAADAGVEFRTSFNVDGLIEEDGAIVGVSGSDRAGRSVVERARVVIGADGLNSVVARDVKPAVTRQAPAFTCGYYAYFADVPFEGVTIAARPGLSVIAGPTNDDLTWVFVQWPAAQATVVRKDLEGRFFEAMKTVPALYERVRAGRRVERFRGAAYLPHYMRKPFGPGWCLVGDAGLHRDPITAQGITDAFRDSELLAAALSQWLSGTAQFDDALGAFERQRDELATPMFELTCQLAALAPPDARMQALLGALRDNPRDTDAFLGAIAGTTDIPTFFAPQNLQRIVGFAPAS
jgi:flavin-dependent dehydrogenase